MDALNRPIYREDWQAEMKRLLAQARPYLTEAEIHNEVDMILETLRAEVVHVADHALRVGRD